MAENNMTEQELIIQGNQASALMPDLKREIERLKKETYQFAIDVGEEDRYKLIAYDKEQKPSLLCLRDDGAVIEVRTVYDSEEKRITVDWNGRWKGKIYVR